MRQGRCTGRRGAAASHSGRAYTRPGRCEAKRGTRPRPGGPMQHRSPCPAQGWQNRWRRLGDMGRWVACIFRKANASRRRAAACESPFRGRLGDLPMGYAAPLSAAGPMLASPRTARHQTSERAAPPRHLYLRRRTGLRAPPPFVQFSKTVWPANLATCSAGTSSLQIYTLRVCPGE
jgi:hypothetical protein